MTTNVSNLLVYYPRTAAEITAGVTPTTTYYPAGDIRRYGALEANADNTSNIQQAIDQCAESGAPVYIPSGTWNVIQLELASNVEIFGDGVNSCLRLKDSGNQFMIASANGALYVDDVYIHDLQLDGNKANNTNGGGILGNGRRNKVTNCYVHDTVKSCIQFGVGSNGSTDTPLAGQHIISDNVCENPGDANSWGAIAITHGNDCLIANNVVRSTDGQMTYGIDIEPNVGNSCNRNVISNNIIDGGRIFVDCAHMSGYSECNVVDGNVINARNSYDPAQSNAAPIFIRQCSDLVISNNSTYGHNSASIGGVFFESSGLTTAKCVVNLSMTGNTFRSDNSGARTGYFALVDGAVVANNTWNISSTGNAVELINTTAARFTGNRIYNSGAGRAFNTTGTCTGGWLDASNYTVGTVTNNGTGFSVDLSVQTAAEIAAGVTPANFAGSSRPWVDAVERYGLVGDGTTDNTTVFTNICSIAGQPLFFRAGTYETGKFTIPSNSVWYLEPGVIIKDKGSLGTNDRFVNFTNKSNIHIIGYGAQILMTRADYPSGEQRHGCYIYNATNITIEGLASNSTGGDGFYIGGDVGTGSHNILLRDISANDNRRQGCSIVNGKNICLINPLLTNTNGTAPAAGLDIEPNNSGDFLEDIKIVNPRCTGNDGAGIEIFLSAWNDTSNYADIEITGAYTSNNGAVSQSGRKRAGIDCNRITSTTPCRGRIKIVDPVCVDETQAGIHVYDWDINGPLLEIVRAEVINPNTSNGTVSSINGGIIFYNSASYTSAPGNVVLDSPMIRDDAGHLLSNSLNPIRMTGGWTQTTITNPKISYTGNPWLLDADSSPTFRSDIELFVSPGNITITDGRYLGRTITNQGQGAAKNVNLPQTTSAMIGWQMAFEVFDAFDLSVTPNAADKIVPVATNAAGGTLVRSSVVGSRLVLECRQVGYWNIVNQTGMWAYTPGTAALPSYTITNLTADRALDCNAAIVTETNDVLGTLIKDLIERGVIGGSTS